MVILVDESVALPLGLFLFGVLFVAIAFMFYLFGKWPERWVFPVLGYIGACAQESAWIVVLAQHSVWWWNFLTITGLVCIASAAIGIACTIKLQRLAANRIADVLLMLAGACQLVAVGMWLFVRLMA